MKKYSLKIYSDFDGTIMKNDVWLNSLGNFIKDKISLNKLCEDFQSGKISTREVNERHLALVEDFSFDKFNSYLDDEAIDEYFRDFIFFCNEREIKLTILSSGLDYYINYILKRENIDLNYYSSSLMWDDKNKKISCSYKFTDEYCRFCDTCKRNLLINNTNDLENEVSVYIGDGVSDFCVSNYADIVFAKGKLASYCWKNNITYYDYNNFSDVKNKLIKLIGTNTIKQRRESSIRRKDIFIGG
ncbi:MAG: HAD-IB family phosphatase [Bacteroidetes bacterium]|nr:HAD-IB family phosphatase [Bacteroidota bacterium]